MYVEWLSPKYETIAASLTTRLESRIETLNL